MYRKNTQLFKVTMQRVCRFDSWLSLPAVWSPRDTFLFLERERERRLRSSAWMKPLSIPGLGLHHRFKSRHTFQYKKNKKSRHSYGSYDLKSQFGSENNMLNHCYHNRSRCHQIISAKILADERRWYSVLKRPDQLEGATLMHSYHWYLRVQ